MVVARHVKCGLLGRAFGTAMLVTIVGLLWVWGSETETLLQSKDDFHHRHDSAGNQLSFPSHQRSSENEGSSRKGIGSQNVNQPAKPQTSALWRERDNGDNDDSDHFRNVDNSDDSRVSRSPSWFDDRYERRIHGPKKYQSPPDGNYVAQDDHVPLRHDRSSEPTYEVESKSHSRSSESNFDDDKPKRSPSRYQGDEDHYETYEQRHQPVVNEKREDAEYVRHVHRSAPLYVDEPTQRESSRYQPLANDEREDADDTRHAYHSAPLNFDEPTHRESSRYQPLANDEREDADDTRRVHRSAPIYDDQPMHRESSRYSRPSEPVYSDDRQAQHVVNYHWRSDPPVDNDPPVRTVRYTRQNDDTVPSNQVAQVSDGQDYVEVPWQQDEDSTASSPSYHTSTVYVDQVGVGPPPRVSIPTDAKATVFSDARLSAPDVAQWEMDMEHELDRIDGQLETVREDEDHDLMREEHWLGWLRGQRLDNLRSRNLLEAFLIGLVVLLTILMCVWLGLCCRRRWLTEEPHPKVVPQLRDSGSQTASEEPSGGRIMAEVLPRPSGTPSAAPRAPPWSSWGVPAAWVSARPPRATHSTATLAAGPAEFRPVEPPPPASPPFAPHPEPWFRPAVPDTTARPPVYTMYPLPSAQASAAAASAAAAAGRSAAGRHTRDSAASPTPPMAVEAPRRAEAVFMAAAPPLLAPRAERAVPGSAPLSARSAASDEAGLGFVPPPTRIPSISGSYRASLESAPDPSSPRVSGLARSGVMASPRTPRDLDWLYGSTWLWSSGADGPMQVELCADGSFKAPTAGRHAHWWLDEQGRLSVEWGNKVGLHVLMINRQGSKLSGLRANGSVPVSATLVRSESAPRLPLPQQYSLQDPSADADPAHGSWESLLAPSAAAAAGLPPSRLAPPAALVGRSPRPPAPPRPALPLTPTVEESPSSAS